MGIKEGLEAILKEGLSDVLTDLSEAIAAKDKSTGKPPKQDRTQSPTRRRK
jgi:hypothetical protein